MLENDVCNEECNNTYCSFDRGDCNIVVLNNSHCNIDNTNNINVNVTYCQTSWVGDQWCDESCRSSENCANDDTDCDCSDTSNYCNLLYSYIGIFWADYIDNNGDYQLTLDAICGIWNDVGMNYLNTILGTSNIVEWYNANKTCLYAFDEMDLNMNNLVNVSELIISERDTFYISEEKAYQVNCSSCVSL